MSLKISTFQFRFISRPSWKREFSPPWPPDTPPSSPDGLISPMPSRGQHAPGFYSARLLSRASSVAEPALPELWRRDARRHGFQLVRLLARLRSPSPPAARMTLYDRRYSATHLDSRLCSAHSPPASSIPYSGKLYTMPITPHDARATYRCPSRTYHTARAPYLVDRRR